MSLREALTEGIKGIKRGWIGGVAIIRVDGEFEAIPGVSVNEVKYSRRPSEVEVITQIDDLDGFGEEPEKAKTKVLVDLWEGWIKDDPDVNL